MRPTLTSVSSSMASTPPMRRVMSLLHPGGMRPGSALHEERGPGGTHEWETEGKSHEMQSLHLAAGEARHRISRHLHLNNLNKASCAYACGFSHGRHGRVQHTSHKPKGACVWVGASSTRHASQTQDTASAQNLGEIVLNQVISKGCYILDLAAT